MDSEGRGSKRRIRDANACREVAGGGCNEAHTRGWKGLTAVADESASGGGNAFGVDESVASNRRELPLKAMSVDGSFEVAGRGDLETTRRATRLQ